MGSVSAFDLFYLIPPEIQYTILSYLSLFDVAATYLAFRDTHKELATVLFHMKLPDGFAVCMSSIVPADNTTGSIAVLLWMCCETDYSAIIFGDGSVTRLVVDILTYAGGQDVRSQTDTYVRLFIMLDRMNQAKGYFEEYCELDKETQELKRSIREQIGRGVSMREMACEGHVSELDELFDDVDKLGTDIKKYLYALKEDFRWCEQMDLFGFCVKPIKVFSRSYSGVRCQCNCGCGDCTICVCCSDCSCFGECDCEVRCPVTDLCSCTCSGYACCYDYDCGIESMNGNCSHTSREHSDCWYDSPEEVIELYSTFHGCDVRSFILALIKMG